MLDDFFNAFSQAPASLNSQPYIDPFDRELLRQQYTDAMRQNSEENRLESEYRIAQARIQQAIQQYDNYLASLDSIDGTSYRGSSMAALESDILAAESNGWYSAF